MSEHASGAFTGEVSAAMLVEFGCRYAIVGHSERRQFYGETDAVVGGEGGGGAGGGVDADRLRRRDARGARGGGDRRRWCCGSSTRSLAARRRGRCAASCVAYEPVWAIGTGRTATPEQAQEVHALLRARLGEAGAADVRVLYGGSVKADNAAALFAMPDVDGGLVGGASLEADEFLAIARA